jgi:hypothetical protein
MWEVPTPAITCQLWLYGLLLGFFGDVFSIAYNAVNSYNVQWCGNI